MSAEGAAQIQRQACGAASALIPSINLMPALRASSARPFKNLFWQDYAASGILAGGHSPCLPPGRTALTEILWIGR
jgi:hypothetical protein